MPVKGVQFKTGRASAIILRNSSFLFHKYSGKQSALISNLVATINVTQKVVDNIQVNLGDSKYSDE
jgi:hypothetical protein